MVSGAAIFCRSEWRNENENEGPKIKRITSQSVDATRYKKNRRRTLTEKPTEKPDGKNRRKNPTEKKPTAKHPREGKPRKGKPKREPTENDRKMTEE